MKKLLFIIALLVPLNSYALEPIAIKQAVTATVRSYNHPDLLSVGKAILKIAEHKRINIPQKDVFRLSTAVLHAHEVTGVDWRLLLAIATVETNLCQYRLFGDKKQGAEGERLFDYWSVGCMQVNTKWWGSALTEAGITQQHMLEYKTGITVGALILKKYLDRYGEHNGIKRYNGIGQMAENYRTKVYRIIKIIS